MPMKPIEFIMYLEKEFNKHSNSVVAKGQKAYMRNQFNFHGLSATERRNIQKPLFKKYISTLSPNIEKVVTNLWKREKS